MNTVMGFDAIFREEVEGGFTVFIPSLPGCVTFGGSMEEVHEMAKEAIELYLESLEAHSGDGMEFQDNLVN